MPLKKKKPVVITGKGVMFDSGGINIKRYEFADMKTDMTGAAVALAVFRLIVEQNIKKNVVAIMPLVENMVSKNAIRPGDVLKSYSGKHVEIVNGAFKYDSGLEVRTGKIEKMSKSKKNVVDPNDIISSYGADTARWFMLSDSPPERDLQWTDTGIAASFKFINKLLSLIHI